MAPKHRQRDAIPPLMHHFGFQRTRSLPAKGRIVLCIVFYSLLSSAFWRGGIQALVSSSAEYKSTPGSLHTIACNFRVARHLVTILKRDSPEEDRYFRILPACIVGRTMNGISFNGGRWILKSAHGASIVRNILLSIGHTAGEWGR